MRRVQLTADEQHRFALQPGDLLFARRSLVAEGAGACCLVADAPEPTVFESSIIRARPNPRSADPRYLYYLFRSPLGHYLLGTILRQVAVSGITGGDLQNLRVPVPPVEEQRAIAYLLTALDDKIELNRRMNENLEAAARTMFESSLSESETSWLRLRDIAVLNGRTLKPSDHPESIRYIDISSVADGVVGETKSYRRGAEPTRARRRLSHGDTVLSTVRPERRSYFLALNPPEDLVVSTGFVTVTTTGIPWTYLYLALTQPTVFEELGRIAHGGAYPAVNPSQVGDLRVPIPQDIRAMARLHDMVEPMLSAKTLNLSESQVLAQLRDLLLPKLVSGEIRVNEPAKLSGS